MTKVIVVGGGAAGLMAGLTAARNGAETILFERMPEPGRKMRITGKGGRVFPASGRAQDVVNTLVDAFVRAGGRLETNTQVTGFVMQPGKVTGVRFCRVKDNGRKAGQDFRSQVQRDVKLGPEHTLAADAVIVCAGGASYPGTGSDGNFVPVLKKMGVAVEPLLPALVYLQPEDGFIEELEGLALKNIEACILADGKPVAKEFGELQILRGTLAGPVCLTLSRKTAQLVQHGAQELELSLDLKPALNEEKLQARLLRDLQDSGKKTLGEVVRGVVPQPLVEPLLDRVFLAADKTVSQVTKKDRLALVQALKHFTIPLLGTGSLAEAIVTAGGVSLKEIDPKTMAAKRFRGLYFAGEVIDVDGYTGGFNLQAAFSTGYVAGLHAAQQKT